MRRKAVSGIIPILLLTTMLTLAFNIQPAEAQTYYGNFEIAITPEFPTTLDEIGVTISFGIASISYSVTFGSVSQVGNEFHVDIDIHVPEWWFPMTDDVEHTYTLGKLPAGSYSFTATVTISGWGFGFDQYSKSFTVSSAVPEFPLGLALEILFIPVIVYIFWRSKQRKKLLHQDSK